MTLTNKRYPPPPPSPTPVTFRRAKKTTLYKKPVTDRLAVRRIERGVLPHCEAVRLVPALGRQRVLCKWSDVNLFTNYILGFLILSKTYCWDRPCWNTRWAGLVQSALDPLARLFRETTSSEIQTTCFVQKVYFTFLSGARFLGVCKSSYWEMWNRKHFLVSEGNVKIQPQMDIYQQQESDILTDFFCVFPPVVCKLSRLESEAVTLPENETYFRYRRF